MRAISVKETQRAVLSLAMRIGGGLSPLLELAWEDFMDWYQRAAELMNEQTEPHQP